MTVPPPPLPADSSDWPDALQPATRWTRLDVVATTASTNADLLDAARQDTELADVVRVAEEQTAGRGRLDRRWESPAGCGLTFSALVRPQAEPGAWGWAPLLAGLAVAEGIEAATGLRADLKWPNDVLLDDRKCAGILVEATGDGRLVIGVGINTHLTDEQLPVPDATSLLIAAQSRGEGDESIQRDAVLAAVLAALSRRIADLDSGPSDAAMADYRHRCITTGRLVRVDRPGRPHLSGTATDIGDDGTLVLDATGGRIVRLSAGDVQLVR